MPKLDVTGLDDFASFMQGLQNDIEGIIKMGVYDGANIVADAVKQSIEALPDDYGRKPKDGKLTGINPIQKQGLIDGFGISKMENDNGFINVKIGFSGYNKIKTKKFPNGQPNLLIARSIESGSSTIKKHVFVRTALNRVKAQAAQAVQNTITKEIEKRERR